MENNLPTLSQIYLAALARHLKPGTASSCKPAQALGRRAVKLGLETLDLARIHEEALVSLVSPPHSIHLSDGMIRRAGGFFAEAITPIEETHRGARGDNLNLQAMVQSLKSRSTQLTTANKELKQEISQRKAVEADLRTSELTSSQLLTKSRHMQEELRFLSRRLLTVQEDERKRISRELHDVIAQTLAGINLKLAALSSQTSANTKDLHEKIALTQLLVEQSVDIVHRFARDLRPAVLDDLGLIPALQSHLQLFMKQTGLRVAFSAFAGVEEQDSVTRTVLYRVAQEALTNVVRHAKARRVSVTLREHETGILMEIYDNGNGFRVTGGKGTTRLGLLGMRERVEMIGGTFAVESVPGQSTTIRVHIPCKDPGPKASPSKKAPAALH